ncbi:hypothetical protein H2204_002741 [Knufia peltigerae]|uniref:Amino acid permease n=1 Tax=Knufia peltigerae TaxID=1002370 RepID=A0AA38YAU4_9EURO|nr:hypothetical protein H2204_002741 [Knufia peltigerae]
MVRTHELAHRDNGVLRGDGAVENKEHRHSVAAGPGEEQADELLNILGYQAELVRSRSTFQVAFMSFVLASVPYGLATTLLYPIAGGGPVAVIWGWCGVCAIILCLAVSLGEITSVYPTAGGVYYQTFMLSPPHYRKITAWICGWSYTLGNIIITLSVNFGTTLFFVGCINIFQDDNGEGIFAAETYQYYLIFLAITLTCNAISALGNRWLPLLDTMTIYWTFGGVFAILICVLVIAKNGRNSGSFALGEFQANTGWTPGWSFCIGLLHAAYATSATGMIISMSEEVRDPGRQVPKAMCWALGLNWLCGIIFLLPLMFVLPDLLDVINDPYAQPLPFILRSAIGNEGGAFALTVPIIVLAIFCGTACTTAASRCIWAFSRDGAMPGSGLWKRINPKLDVPFNAMMLSMSVQILLGLIYFGSAAAFNAFSGSGVIFLTISYVMPVIVSLLGGRTHLREGSWDFGKLGAFCNVITICWTLFIIPVFSFPFFNPVTLEGMNYASVVFVGGVTISAVWYFVWGKKNYEGPPVRADEVERRRSSIISTSD